MSDREEKEEDFVAYKEEKKKTPQGSKSFKLSPEPESNPL